MCGCLEKGWDERTALDRADAQRGRGDASQGNESSVEAKVSKRGVVGGKTGEVAEDFDCQTKMF